MGKKPRGAVNFPVFVLSSFFFFFFLFGYVYNPVLVCLLARDHLPRRFVSWLIRFVLGNTNA